MGDSVTGEAAFGTHTWASSITQLGCPPLPVGASGCSPPPSPFGRTMPVVGNIQSITGSGEWVWGTSHKLPDCSELQLPHPSSGYSDPCQRSEGPGTLLLRGNRGNASVGHTFGAPSPVPLPSGVGCSAAAPECAGERWVFSCVSKLVLGEGKKLLRRCWHKSVAPLWWLGYQHSSCLRHPGWSRTPDDVSLTQINSSRELRNVFFNTLTSSVTWV